jgi:hypothetical protein
MMHWAAKIGASVIPGGFPTGVPKASVTSIARLLLVALFIVRELSTAHSPKHGSLDLMSAPVV